MEAVEGRPGAGFGGSNVDRMVLNGRCEEIHSHGTPVRARRSSRKAHDVSNSFVAGKLVDDTISPPQASVLSQTSCASGEGRWSIFLRYGAFGESGHFLQCMPPLTADLPLGRHAIFHTRTFNALSKILSV